MKNESRITWLVGAAFVVAACIISSVPVRAADTTPPNSDQVSKLLAQVNAEAVELRRDAEDMESFSRSKLSWESHASKINMIKDHINKTGSLLTQLGGLRNTASLWQQEAIDRVAPLLKEMASNTETTIEHINQNQSRLNSTEFQDYVKANYNLASRLASLIGDFVDYGEAKEKYERLSRKLEVPEH